MTSDHRKAGGMKRTVVLVLLLVLSIFTSSSAFGQATATGTISGTVMDKSDSIISGAEVVITSRPTGASRTATSSDEGSFRFDFLSAGSYTVKISKSGFSPVVPPVELLVRPTATANAVLNPGSVTETIEVTAESPLVDVAKTSVSMDITPRQVEDLPMVGRDAANLAYLPPGVKA